VVDVVDVVEVVDVVDVEVVVEVVVSNFDVVVSNLEVVVSNLEVVVSNFDVVGPEFGLSAAPGELIVAVAPTTASVSTVAAVATNRPRLLVPMTASLTLFDALPAVDATNPVRRGYSASKSRAMGKSAELPRGVGGGDRHRPHERPSPVGASATVCGPGTRRSPSALAD
jgi:hypothetical protein